MRLASGVLKGVDTVAPANNKGVPSEVPHLDLEYCQQLEEHLCQEDHRKKKNRGDNCPVIFHLGHLDHSVGGVISNTGLHGPPLRLVSRHNLPSLGRKNVP